MRKNALNIGKAEFVRADGEQNQFGFDTMESPDPLDDHVSVSASGSTQVNFEWDIPAFLHRAVFRSNDPTLLVVANPQKLQSHIEITMHGQGDQPRGATTISAHLDSPMGHWFRQST